MVCDPANFVNFNLELSVLAVAVWCRLCEGRHLVEGIDCRLVYEAWARCLSAYVERETDDDGQDSGRPGAAAARLGRR